MLAGPINEISSRTKKKKLKSNHDIYTDIIESSMEDMLDETIINLTTMPTDKAAEFLQHNINETLSNSIYSTSCSVKVLSDGFNKTFKLSLGGEPNPIAQYCLTLKTPSLFPGIHYYDSSEHYNGHDASECFGKIYARRKVSTQTERQIAKGGETVYLLELSPYYINGNLMSYMEFKPRTKHLKERYNTYRELSEIRFHYYSVDGEETYKNAQANNGGIALPEIRNATSVNTALQLLTQERTSTMRFFSERREPSAVKGYLDETNKRIEDEIEQICDTQSVLNLSSNRTRNNKFKLSHSAPDIVSKERLSIKQQNKRTLRRYNSCKENINNLLSFSEKTLEDLNLNIVLSSRENQLLNMAEQLIDMLLTLKESDLHFFDLKPENFLVDENGKIVILDTKSLIQFERDSDQIPFASHIDYLPPDLVGHSIGSRVLKTLANQILSYQLGATLYNITVGVGGAHEGNNSRVYKLMQNRVKNSFNFDMPCFKTDAGSKLKAVIMQLTDTNPENRLSLEGAKSIISEESVELICSSSNQI